MTTAPTSFPLHWPTGFRRTPGGERRAAAFRTRDTSKGYPTHKSVTVAVARDRLQRELDLLRAADIILSTNLELRLDGQPRSDRAAPADPGAAVYFRLAGKDTALACDTWATVADNITALAKHIEALRGMDRWGVGSLAQAFAGYQALAAPASAPEAENWWHVLGLNPYADEAEIELAFRHHAKTAHPDVGGSNAAMARLNAARKAGLEAQR